MRIIALVVSVVLYCFGSCRASSTKTVHVLLGSTIVIDCEGVTHAKEIKWFFRKDSKASKHLLYGMDKQGLSFHHTLKDVPRRTAAKNMSLIITDFNKDSEGTYICEVCHDASTCTVTTSQCILEDKPLLSKCLYAVRGGVYEQECQRPVGKTGNWTFLLRGNAKQYSQTSPPVLTDIQDPVVGNSTCWIAAQDGQRERAFLLVHCIISGIAAGRESVQTCTLMCGKLSDMERAGPVVVTERKNITAFQAKGPCGLIDCNATVEGEVHRQANSSAGFSNPTDRKLAWVSLSVVGLCCCMVTVLVARRRTRAVTVSNTDCPRDDCHINSSAKTELHYSSVCLRRSEESVLRSAHECVYSDIKVENEKIMQ